MGDGAIVACEASCRRRPRCHTFEGIRQFHSKYILGPSFTEG